MRDLNYKQAAAAWGEDLLPRFTVSNKGDHAVLIMSKWGVRAQARVHPKFFENSETDYRETAIQVLYSRFLDLCGPTQLFEDFIPAPHELTVPNLKVELPAEPADDAELEHTALAPPDLQDLNVHNAKDIVAEIESPEVLVTLKHQERDGKNRKTVLEAINAALEAFDE